jgi:hypothetical protein
MGALGRRSGTTPGNTRQVYTHWAALTLQTEAFIRTRCQAELRQRRYEALQQQLGLLHG